MDSTIRRPFTGDTGPGIAGCCGRQPDRVAKPDNHPHLGDLRDAGLGLIVCSAHYSVSGCPSPSPAGVCEPPYTAGQRRQLAHRPAATTKPPRDGEAFALGGARRALTPPTMTGGPSLWRAASFCPRHLRRRSWSVVRPSHGVTRLSTLLPSYERSM